MRAGSVRVWAMNIEDLRETTRLSKRIVRNVEYFQSNYFFVFLGLFAYCL